MTDDELLAAIARHRSWCDRRLDLMKLLVPEVWQRLGVVLPPLRPCDCGAEPQQFHVSRLEDPLKW